MAHLLANWLTILRNCNALIHSQVQSPSNFHQLASAPFPASLPPCFPLAPSPQSHLCFLLFASMALYSKLLFLLSQIFFSLFTYALCFTLFLPLCSLFKLSCWYSQGRRHICCVCWTSAALLTPSSWGKGFFSWFRSLCSCWIGLRISWLKGIWAFFKLRKCSHTTL